MKRMLMLVMLLFALALAACGAGKGKLEGSAWQLVTMAGAPVVEGSTVTLSFEAGGLGGTAGCNSYGGEYSVKGDTLEIGALMSTLMACADDAVTQQESLYLQALGGAQTFSLGESELRILSAEGSELVFNRRSE